MALKPAQTKLLQAILDPANRTLGDAAKAAGVPHRTAQTWMNRPDFRAELDRIEGDALDGVARRTVTDLDDVESLYSTMLNDESKPDHVRLRAAQLLADLALRLWEARNLERRVRQLESATSDDWIQAE